MTLQRRPENRQNTKKPITLGRRNIIFLKPPCNPENTATVYISP
jgi:hypothetical protein